MTNNFTGQLKQMQETILAERGTVITYKQRGNVIKNIPAVPAKTKFLNDKRSDTRSQYAAREYIVEFGLLTWYGKQIKPKPGDNIVDGDHVYEICENEIKQCYCHVDSIGKYVRIFVQRVNVVGNGSGGNNAGCHGRPMSEAEVRAMYDRIFGET